MTPGRLKLITLLVGIALSGLTLLAWSQLWFTVVLKTSQQSEPSIAISGGVAAPALVALGLAGLALVAALAIAGPVFRIILGVLQVAISVAVVWSSALAMTAPISVSSSSITKATGISGTHSVAALVASTSQTAWPWLAIVFGVLTGLLGVFVVASSRRWPGSSRRYQAVRLEDAESTANPVSDWDRLSGGSDPTSR